MPYKGNGWEPQRIIRFVKSYATATSVVRVDTDQGEGFLKALGNPEGPHVLACELVGTIMGDELGLPTLDYSIIEIQADDEIPLANGAYAQAGPAFITRAIDGFTWGGDEGEIAATRNLDAITSLVVLDTWILNCDRYAPNGTRINRDKVFFARPNPQQEGFVLMAIDHTHAFTCGHELHRRLGFIDVIQNENVYGLFPEFQRHICPKHLRHCIQQLKMITRDTVADAVAQIPDEWQVNRQARQALRTFLYERAEYATVASQLIIQGSIAASVSTTLWTNSSTRERSYPAYDLDSPSPRSRTRSYLALARADPRLFFLEECR